MARINLLDIESRDILSAEAALCADDAGDEQVLDGDERRCDGLGQQTLGHLCRENVAEEKIIKRV